jgi:hypothetical protein
VTALDMSAWCGSVAHTRSAYSGRWRATSSGDGMRAISSAIVRAASRWPAQKPGVADYAMHESCMTCVWQTSLALLASPSRM